MRSTRNTVGGVFAAITAGISLVMAIWDVVSWIMTMSLGNIFAGRPFLSFFVALFQESILILEILKCTYCLQELCCFS